MYTDRSSSSYIRQQKARAIASYNNTFTAFVNAGRDVSKRTEPSDTSASVVNELRTGGLLCCLYPNPATDVFVVAGNGQVLIYFKAENNPRDDVITTYTVTSFPDIITASGIQSPILVEGLTNEIPYRFSIVATNIYGSSAPSEFSNIAIPSLPAPIPTTWVDASAGSFSTRGYAVANGLGKWIAVGWDATTPFKTSMDGENWSDLIVPNPFTYNGRDITTDGAGNWVAVGDSSLEPGKPSILYSSTNGNTWLQSTNDFITTSGSGRGFGVATDKKGRWMAVGYNKISGMESTVKISTDNGATWTDTAYEVFSPGVNGQSVGYGNGVWVVGGQRGTRSSSIIYSTDNGATWKFSSGSFVGSNTSACYSLATNGAGTWVAVGSSGPLDATIKYSTDNGKTWNNAASNTFSSYGYGVKYYDGKFVATGIGNSTTSIKYSTDGGVNWNNVISGAFGITGYDVEFGNGKWVAVGAPVSGSGSIKYSIS